MNFSKDNFNETITLTWGDQGENHVGLEKIGFAADDGFTLDDCMGGATVSLII